MNKSIIRYIAGCVLLVEGLFLFLPYFVSLIYHESSGLAYLVVGFASILLGRLLTYKKPVNNVFYAKEGFLSVALSWVILSFVGALPFWLSREIPSLTDALFETVSGFTTTGSSILTNVEALSYCHLFWRSFTHWLGGMGVLVFILAVLPLSGGYNMHLMRAESPGPTVGKLVPRLRTTAMILYGIYFFMTFVLLVILLLAGMPWFDAFCTAFGTAGTGGFGIKVDSMGSYSSFIQVVVAVFMILFGINFNVYYLFLIKKFKDALCCEEMRWYLGIIAVSVLLITFNISSLYSIQDALKHALFQVGSIITTTGFATVDFNLWPEFSKTILVLLMFVGACAGSTGGGIKVSRIVILGRTLKKEIEHYLHPRSIKIIRFEGKKVEHSVLRNINVFMVTYLIIFALSLLIVSLDNFDFTSNFTGVACTLNNIGPGLNIVGPAGSFASYSILSKLVFIFDMLAGRLEVFPMLLFFCPVSWKKS